MRKTGRVLAPSCFGKFEVEVNDFSLATHWLRECLLFAELQPSLQSKMPLCLYPFFPGSPAIAIRGICPSFQTPVTRYFHPALGFETVAMPLSRPGFLTTLHYCVSSTVNLPTPVHKSRYLQHGDCNAPLRHENPAESKEFFTGNYQ